MAVVGGGGKGDDGEGVNSAGVGNSLQVSFAEGSAMWEQELGGYRGYIKNTRGIPCAFPACVDKIYKYWFPTISPSSQPRYAHVDNFYYNKKLGNSHGIPLVFLIYPL